VRVKPLVDEVRRLLLDEVHAKLAD
jgi:hypothetical protein